MPSDLEPDEFLKDDAAARVLRQKRSTLAAWRATGRGPAYFKVGRTVLYHPNDIRDWLAAQRHRPRASEPGA